MATSIPPKGPAKADADIVRTADGSSDYASSPMADATARTHQTAAPGAPVDRAVDRKTHTPDLHTRTHPRASTDAAPAADDAIVRAADGSSDYEHSDMAEAVDEAQHKLPK